MCKVARVKIEKGEFITLFPRLYPIKVSNLNDDNFIFSKAKDKMLETTRTVRHKTNENQKGVQTPNANENDPLVFTRSGRKVRRSDRFSI